jgi:hypothetical protein
MNMHKNGLQLNKGGNMTVGMKVEHVFTKDWLLVLEFEGPDKVLCRTKDLRELWFYRFELKQIG